MASYSYTFKYGSDWSATVTVNYTTSYNASTNQTTVALGNVSWAYFGRAGWGTSASSTITITAADNTSSTGSTSATTPANSSTHGGVKTFTGTPTSSPIVVTHASGAGIKSIQISIASKVFVNPTSGGNTQVWISGNDSTTVTSATTYSLTISQGSNTTITVKRNGSTLSNGAILMTGDSLTISISANTGYTLTTRTVNGNTFADGTYTVSGNVTVKSAATLNTYTLTINQGTGTIISVKKGSTTLNNGATISYGDSLIISISAKTGYNLGTHTVNGSNFTSGTYSVTGAVTVVSTANVKSFVISIPTVSNCTFSVIRTSSPLQSAGTGPLSNGDKIYYNDVISITANSAAGYGISSLTVNETSFENGASIIVTEEVRINASVIVTTTFTVTITQKGGTGELIQVFNGETRVTNGESVIQGSQLTYILNIPDNYWVKNFSINDNIKYVNSAISFTIEVAENPSVDTSVLQNITIPIIRKV